MDVDAERVLLQPIGVGRRLKDDGEDSAPALGRGERLIDVATLGPGDAEAIVGSTYDARNLDGDLDLADFGEGVAGAGIVIEG